MYIQLFDLHGKSIFKESYSVFNNTIKINTTHFKSGLYTYKVNDAYHNYTGKFIIKR